MYYEARKVHYNTTTRINDKHSNGGEAQVKTVVLFFIEQNTMKTTITTTKISYDLIDDEEYIYLQSTSIYLLTRNIYYGYIAQDEQERERCDIMYYTE